MKADYKIDNPRLRAAMLKVFGEKCFYSGQKVTEENMVIDHIVPKNKGGKDSVYNYALCSKSINSKKSDTIDKDGVAPVLYLIKMSYAPKVLSLLESPKSIRCGKKMATVYVDEAKWEKVKESAYQARISVGRYLLDLHEAHGSGTAILKNISEPQPDQSEDLQSEIDRLNKLIVGERVDLQIAKETLAVAMVKEESGEFAEKESEKSAKGKRENPTKPKKPKSPKKNESGACSECGAPAGHRPTCSLRVK